MSSTDDFTWNGSTDALLKRMSEELQVTNPNDDATSMIAGILWLDHAKGIAKDGDYVLLNPSVAMWLLMDVEILNEEMLALQDQDDEPDEDASVRFEELAAKPFQIRLADDESVPSNVRGQIVTISVMKEDEMMDGPLDSVFAISLHEDGTLVEASQTYRRQLV